MFLQINFGWHLQNITGDSHDSVRAAPSGGNCRSVKHCEKKAKETRQQSGSSTAILKECSTEIGLEMVVLLI